MVNNDCHIELDEDTETTTSWTDTPCSSCKSLNPFEACNLESLMEPSKHVSFHESVEVVLIPLRHEFTCLFPDIWYNAQDFHDFECDAYFETRLVKVDQISDTLESNDLTSLSSATCNDLILVTR